MEERPILNDPTRRPFSKEEKVALILVIVAGIGGTFLGFRFLGKNLQEPFQFSYTGERYLSTSDQEAAEQEALKARDTDADTLNDYDELYVYKTSPYLADSDSDGYNDATEIASGNDPSCPEGRECVGTASADTVADPSSSMLEGLEPPEFDMDAAQATLDAQPQLPSGAVSAEDLEALKNLSTEDLRLLLIEGGVEKEIIDAMSDEELRALYEDVLADLETTP